MQIINKLLILSLFFVLVEWTNSMAQVARRGIPFIHAHNDYAHPLPFWSSYSSWSNSIEADIFLIGGELYVAHERNEILPQNTLRDLYLEPIRQMLKRNGGRAYENGEYLQLMIDLKTNYEETLPVLEKILLEYKDCFDVYSNPKAVKVVVSGSRPAPIHFVNYDKIIHFDGDLGGNYSSEQKERIAMISMPFSNISNWNGKGKMLNDEFEKLKSVIENVHSQGKMIRFWGCPDTKTAWILFRKVGVDFLNTDKPQEVRQFLDHLATREYVGKHQPYEPYVPAYKVDRADKFPRNVIVLISDGGAGQAQLWGAVTANGGKLNLLNMRNVGLVNTSSADDYITDSAAAGTALATGNKTNNRRIGTDVQGGELRNIIEVLAARGYVTGIVSNDEITGATPSAYYAHQTDRDMTCDIAEDLVDTPASLIIGKGGNVFANQDSALVKELREENVAFCCGIDNLSQIRGHQRMICVADDDYNLDKRIIEKAFDTVVERFSKNKKGFFVVFEGAKIDQGGHSNNVNTIIDEYLSFDRTVGKALQFADSDGHTLVIVLSDHETGGMTILDGNIQERSVLADFSTSDHTGVPALIYAYGPQGNLFCGFQDNTDIYKKILYLLK